jgi:predicted nuclease of predicted toxin-antitoxin system
VKYLSEAGYETVHVNNILDGWNTTDRDNCKIADANDFIVITKDYDFRNSFFINKSPRKLIKVNLGNISTSDLITSVSRILTTVEKLNRKSFFLIEIDKVITTFIDE